MAMSKKMLVLIFLTISILPSDVDGYYQVKKFPSQWLNWPEEVMFGHLLNMTAEIFKDTTQKLKHAERIKDLHSHSITYELGSIAAAILERFHQMLKLYRKYSDLHRYRTETVKIYDIMYAYHITQGYFNEIRLEKDLFYQVKKRHESTEGTLRYPIRTRRTKGPYYDIHFAKDVALRTRKGKLWSPSE